MSDFKIILNVDKSRKVSLMSFRKFRNRPVLRQESSFSALLLSFLRTVLLGLSLLFSTILRTVKKHGLEQGEEVDQ